MIFYGTENMHIIKGFIVYHQNPLGLKTQVIDGVFGNMMHAFLECWKLLVLSRKSGDMGSVYGIHYVERDLVHH